MGIIFALISAFALPTFAANVHEAQCQKFQTYCACFPAVPLEGFKLHIVEVCDGKEEWYTTYDAPVFDTESQCLEATMIDPVCVDLLSHHSHLHPFSRTKSNQ